MMSNTSETGIINGSSTTSTFLIWKYLPDHIRNKIIMEKYCDGLSLYNFISSLYWNATIRFEYIDKNTTKNNITNDTTREELSSKITKPKPKPTKTAIEEPQSVKKIYYISSKDPYVGFFVKSMMSIGRCRIDSALQKIEYSSNRNGNYASDALLWLRTTTASLVTEIDNCILMDDTIWNQCTDNNGSSPIIQSCKNTVIIDHKKSILFKNTLYHFFMILEYLETSIRDYKVQFYLQTRNVFVDLYEWPIWCGVIILEVDIVDETDATTITITAKKRYTASVVITSPISDRLHPVNILLPGCNQDLSKSSVFSLAKPTQAFKCEPYSNIPIEQPWGRIRGMTKDDDIILEKNIGQYLNDTSQIGIPIQLNPDLNVRIMTQHCARVKRQQHERERQQLEQAERVEREQLQLERELEQLEREFIRQPRLVGRNRIDALRQQQLARDRLRRQHEVNPTWNPTIVSTEWILHEPSIVPDSMTPLSSTNDSSNGEDINQQNFSTIGIIVEESTMFNTQYAQCNKFPLICTWDKVDDTSSRNSKIHFSERDSMEYLINVQKMAQDCSKLEV